MSTVPRDDAPIVKFARRASEIYSRGFLFSVDAPAFIPPHFHRRFPGIHLYVGPKTDAVMSARAGASVILIGNAVDPDNGEADESAVCEALCAALEQGLAAFLAINWRLTGRFAIIYAVAGQAPCLINDATGMRTVFIGRFEGRLYVASHARLVARQEDQVRYLPSTPFMWGYPGLFTPFKDVFTHSPSTILDLINGSCRRIYGNTPVVELTVEDAAARLGARASQVLQAVANRRQIVLSLTAGNDSRTTLAVALPLKAQLKFFTYKQATATDTVDVAVAAEMAAACGLDHTVMKYREIDEETKAWQLVLNENTYSRHGYGLALEYVSSFGFDKVLHVRSNIIEYYRQSAVDKILAKGRMATTGTPEAAAAFYIKCAGPEMAKHRDFVVDGFRHQFETTDYASALQHTDARDLYFVEHRMAAWHANLLLESDMAFDTMIIFNSREMLDWGRAVPKDVRVKNVLVHEIVRQRAPDLLKWPYNPPKWPLE